MTALCTKTCCLENKCREDIRDITVMKNTEPGSDKIWILKLSFINIIWNLRTIPRRKCEKDFILRWEGYRMRYIHLVETANDQQRREGRPAIEFVWWRGEGWGGTMHYQVRSPLPALSLSISEIRKRDPAAVLSLVDPFEIQSNKRNDIPFPMLRRTQRLLVSWFLIRSSPVVSPTYSST